MRRCCLAACCYLTPALADPLPCDDGIKTAFRPDADTSVVAVRLVKKGEELKAPDASQPITAAADLCLVKLLVGPGATAEKDKNARSWSEGIGIEVWLPTHANWNERIRNYGGGGWVGGGHRYADKIGSKVPAIVNANIGYASGTTDAGQPWYQDGSFAFLSDGKVNVESLRDFSVRAMVEQAVKTKALVNLYYGKAPKYTYYDGHSQGGRQGMKLVQEYPELYDGYMIAQPALSIAKFGTAGLYPQIVMKTELGFTAANKPEAAAFAAKVAAANKRAVAACDKPGLGFLLDPFACDYNPARDADGAVRRRGRRGRDRKQRRCRDLHEPEGGERAEQDLVRRHQRWKLRCRAERRRAVRQIARQEPALVDVHQEHRHRQSDHERRLPTASRWRCRTSATPPDASTASGDPITNASTDVRNKWLELDYAGLADAVNKGVALQPTLFSDLITDKADLAKLRDLGRKVIVYTGLVDDAIPPAGNINYHERVVAAMGGHAEVQKFMRMYLLPGSAHSSQGRAYTVGGKNDTVPLPKLPGNANQTPTREQDQFFTALVDWVEKGAAPGEILLTSRDNSVSYPVCVYPLRTTWNGNGDAKQASSYSCR